MSTRLSPLRAAFFAVLSCFAVLAGCWGKDAYIVEGTVIEVTSSSEVVIDHEEVYGLMGAMVMPFRVRDPALLDGVRPGARVVARLRTRPEGAFLDKLRVTGHGVVPSSGTPSGPAPLRPGERLPRTEIPVHGGDTWVIGQGQPSAVAVAFLYTTCPIPEFCPAVVTRLQGLQDAVGADARILAVTIDPEGDTLEVLARFADTVGAKPEVWRFGRLEGTAFQHLVQRAALSLVKEGSEVVHALRLLVLDAEGRLVERYDDNRWPEDRVVQQLRTGGPSAPPGSDGTLTRHDEPEGSPAD